MQHFYKLFPRVKQRILLMPVGDIQWTGTKGSTATEMLKRHIEWGVDQGAWFLGLGDYLDFASPSNRQRLRSAALYDAAEDVISDKALELVFDLFETVLKPSVGRWLGLLEGHHFHQLKDGTTTDMRLCEMLKAPFLGTSVSGLLEFPNPRANKGPGELWIWAHHGAGSGETLAAPLTKLDNLSKRWEGYDIFLMGHQSKKIGGSVDHVLPLRTRGRLHLIHRTRILACTGSFMRGYQEGRKDGLVPRGNYVEQKMLPPTQLGAPIIYIEPRWHRIIEDGKERREVWQPDMTIVQ